MNAGPVLDPGVACVAADSGVAADAADDWRLLSDPDITALAQQLVQSALHAPRLSSGRRAAHFEAGFARWAGRAQAVAVPGGTLRTWLALPLHGHLQPEHVRFIVKTLKDASPNVGAGAAIY
jgi:dTDP-4-amino-4,6-dideoxygalactose transaminase